MESLRTHEGAPERGPPMPRGDLEVEAEGGVVKYVQ